MNSPALKSRPTKQHLPWLLALPKFGIVLLMAALLTLLWLLQHSEREEQRSILIKDVLWLEQNLRFHLEGNRDLLQQLAVDMADPQERERVFRLRSAHLLKNSPEISQISWLDADRRSIVTLPGHSQQEETARNSAHTARAFEVAKKLGKPAYSAPFFTESKDSFIELLVPVFDESRLIGMILANYPLNDLLTNQVPWWFTEKYKVEIVDDSDTLYASKTHIEGLNADSYQIPFDPPGHGLRLKVSNYPNDQGMLQRLLTVSILLLAGGVFWSLWLIRDLMHKSTRAEEALRAEHAFRAAMEDSLTVGMRARDLSGRIIYVNPAFCRMTGFAAEELVDHEPPMPYWAPEHLDDTQAMHRAVMAGQAPSDGFEITFMRKDGERFRALVYEAKLIDGNGQHTGWMASVLDITERERAEELARQQQEQLQFTARLVTLGEMASTLAHELNQPLAAIASYNTGCLNLLATDNLSCAELKPALEKIGVQAQRAGRIIRRVHDFVRKSEPKRAPCALGEVIDDCLGFAEPEARKRQIRIDAKIPPLPLLPADRLMLEQVLLNLMRNAMDAMSDTPTAYRVLKLAAIVDGEEVRVSVSDHGCGISPEIEDKLYTAFFTTKQEGMGVGLSICRSIIEFHRGRLWAEKLPDSPTGSGTIFIFTLPLESA
ncbi:PAS domain-containing sensor histidine kinase [Azonexus hydrophilus]|uniref:histidine kinase n=1 Tax=Azonexus hydrophilus TaxID=418702 RepID=A0A1R1I0X8_9RHOO|nr:PAS domain S-box protein [Azonexus hydrophilus]OMG52378.1 PAS domain-containing sensor histidine kinase [Azonexus hydrophilus]